MENTLTPVLRRQKQVDLYIFKDSFIFKVSSRLVGATQKIPASWDRVGDKNEIQPFAY